MKMSRTCTFLLGLLALSGPALAAEDGAGFDSKNLFLGGGLGSNHVAGSSRATGFQIFAGYELFELKQIKLDAEATIMTSGKLKRSGKKDVEATSYGATAVARYQYNHNVELLARGGYFAGDMKNFAFGGGAGYVFNENFSLRLEYVQRIYTIGSVLVNVVYRL